MSQILLKDSISVQVNYFPALTGIRAVAAFLVYFHHFNPFAGGTLPFKLVHEFHIGVSVFFVLSGFLICYRYYPKVGVSRQWYGDYLVNRFARIFPVYFLLTTLVFIFYFRDTEHFWAKYFLNVTLLKGLFNEFKFSGIAQAWSLTVEECFYVSAPFIFLLVKKNKWALLILPLGFLALGVGLVLAFSEVNFYGFFSELIFMGYYTFLGRSFEFFAGIALALLLRMYKPAKVVYQLPVIGFFTFFGLLLIGGCIAGLAYFSWFSSYGFVIANIMLPVFIAVFFWGLLKEGSALRKMLESRLFLLLGKSSYIFYLIHLGFIQSAISTYISGNVIVIFILLNILSIFLYYTVEEPMHKRIRNFIKNR